MGRSNYLALKTEQDGADLINQDLNDLKMAAKNLINHATTLGGIGFGTAFLRWIASFAAILPYGIFSLLRGDVGKWIAFVAVVLRLFFPRHFPDWLEMPGSLILLLVVAPGFFAYTLRDSWVGVAICLIIGCYLLQEHIRASGGFRNSFTQSNGISNTLGIVMLLVFPVWALIVHAV